MYCVLSLLIFSLFGCVKPKPVGNQVVEKSVEEKISLKAPNQLPNVKLLWKYKIDETSQVCDPVVYKNLIYTINGNNLVALDIYSGKEIWKVQTNSIEGSYPTISNNILVFGSYDTYVYALNATTGDLLWKFKTKEDIHSKSWIEKGVVYIGSDDGHLYALELLTGKLIWKQSLGRIQNEPLVIEDTIFMYVDYNKFFSIDAKTGKINWTKDIKHRFGYTGKKPVIVNNAVIYGCDNGYCYAFDRMTGEILWIYKTVDLDLEKEEEGIGLRAILAEPVVYKKSVIIFSDGSIHALDSSNGKLLWQINMDQPLESDPIIYDDTMYLGGNDGRLYAINLLDHSIKLVFDDYEVNEPIRREGKDIRTDKPLLIGTTIYFRTWDTYLYAIQLPDIKTLNLKTTKPENTITQRNANFMNGSILVKEQDWIYYISSWGYGLYKMKVDGSEYVNLATGSSLSHIILSGDRVYYFDHFNLLSIKKDGTDKKK